LNNFCRLHLYTRAASAPALLLTIIVDGVIVNFDSNSNYAQLIALQKLVPCYTYAALVPALLVTIIVGPS
jgi:hypothetical protein